MAEKIEGEREREREKGDREIERDYDEVKANHFVVIMYMWNRTHKGRLQFKFNNRNHESSSLYHSEQ